MSTSMVYLFRSLGTVWGVAASSTIIQNVLATRLPLALAGVPEREKVVYIFFFYQFLHFIGLTSGRLWMRSVILLQC